MTKIAIIIGSTRPARVGESVARWVYSIAKQRTDAEFEIVDLVDYNLPLYDEDLSPSQGQYKHEHTKAWAAKIASFDGFVFVAPEYNHGINAALKNAIDYLYTEWNNKAAGFVSYGGVGGARAVEQLRQVISNVMIADVRAQVMLSLFTDFENSTKFKPSQMHEQEVNAMLDQVISWANALKPLRANDGWAISGDEANSYAAGETRSENVRA